MTSCLAVSLILAQLAAGADETLGQHVFPWPGWGGPNGDSRVDSPPLANSWTESGPTVLWEREFGEGYSTIVCDGPRLFSMVRRPSSGEEVVVALDAETGETLWEYAYATPIEEDMDVEFGPGPHSTPLLVGDLVICVSVTVKVHALDRRDGTLCWQTDLRADLEASHLKRGYCPSPIAYPPVDPTEILLPIGGENQAIVALSATTGEVTRKGHSFNWSYASLVLIDHDDGPELIAFWDDAIGGVDPETFELRWSVPHQNSWRVNVSSPIWDSNGTLFASSAYGLGSRAIHLERSDGATTATPLWLESRVQIHHGNAIQVGDHVYASSGRGPAVFSSIHMKTGELAWRDRAIGKSTLVYADEKIIALDGSGELFLIDPSPEELKVLAQAQVLGDNAWSQPTLIGTTLYARDRSRMIALDLGFESH